MTQNFLKIDVAGIDVPLYSRIINCGLYSYAKTAFLIDNLKCLSYEKEWEKVKVLINDLNYIHFISELLEVNECKIVEFLNDFLNDLKFKTEFSQKLFKFDEEYNPDKGDVRFHSLTLYVLVRALKPKIMIETGVNYGKSSSLILSAMEHNQRGKLISIDLPNKSGNILPDGSKTNTGSHDVGWLVPDYLKNRWDLRIGDSKLILPELLNDIDELDIFLHDSLHTYEHAKFEFNSILPKLKTNFLVLCDNIDLGAGSAFNDFLKENNLVGYAYRDFGGVMVK